MDFHTPLPLPFTVILISTPNRYPGGTMKGRIMAHTESRGKSAPLKPSPLRLTTAEKRDVNRWLSRHSVHISITPQSMAGHGPTGRVTVALVSASGARIFYDDYVDAFVGLSKLYDWLICEYIPAFADSPL